MLLEGSNGVNGAKVGLIYRCMTVMPVTRVRLAALKCRHVHTVAFWCENSFTEMTEKLMHMCENYCNRFIYIRTTFKYVVFVEFLRG